MGRKRLVQLGVGPRPMALQAWPRSSRSGEVPHENDVITAAGDGTLLSSASPLRLPPGPGLDRPFALCLKQREYIASESIAMPNRAVTAGGLAVAGGVGYYLYQAGGDPKVAQKQAEGEKDEAKLAPTVEAYDVSPQLTRRKSLPTSNRIFPAPRRRQRRTQSSQGKNLGRNLTMLSVIPPSPGTWCF